LGFKVIVGHGETPLTPFSDYESCWTKTAPWRRQRRPYYEKPSRVGRRDIMGWRFCHVFIEETRLYRRERWKRRKGLSPEVHKQEKVGMGW
jgi:hypothetical protein